jgi:pimeloyl-ACP methyl ester carboxylesterase
VTSSIEETAFTIEAGGRVVPAVLWNPAGVAAPTPLLLAGHGGGFGFGGSKRADSVVDLALILARDHRIATVAIDQPGCGDRPGAEEEQDRRRGMTIEEAIAALWTEELVMEMAADWRATVDHVQHGLGLGDGPLAYWGVSGGTTFGLPLVATEPRIVVAVLGLNSAVPLMSKYAPQVACPVLYLQNLDDTFMTREASLDLFDRLGSKDKRVHAHPGNHGQFPADEQEDVARFLATRLHAAAAVASPA